MDTAVPPIAPVLDNDIADPPPITTNTVDVDIDNALVPPVVGDADQLAAPAVKTSTSTSEEPAAGTDTAAESEVAGLSTVLHVTVMIHGSAVDITDTGIDPTFLEALPDDTREDDLNQHVRDQHASRIERPPDSQISAEFLDALPPEIRAEIIQQKAIKRARQRAEAAPPTGVPAELNLNPASFIVTLNPTLRQAILLDQDDSFIQTLPSHMIAEAGAYHESRGPHQQLATRSSGPHAAAGAASGSTVPRKFVPQHDAMRPHAAAQAQEHTPSHDQTSASTFHISDSLSTSTHTITNITSMSFPPPSGVPVPVPSLVAGRVEVVEEEAVPVKGRG
jgi:E3 ubiquitin-protein ligase HUWE1